MSELTEIVQVDITRDTKAVSQAGFGKLLIMACHTAWPDLVKEYSDPADMLTDGFTVNSPAYKKALIMASQSPRPPTFLIGRRKLLPTQSFRMVPKNFTEGYKYEFTIVSPAGVSTAISITTPAAANLAAMTALFQTAIDAIAGLTSTDNGADVETDADVAGAVWAITGLPAHRHLGVEVFHADPGVATDLADVRVEADDWYAWCLDSNSEAEILAAAAATEAIGRLFFAVTPDNGVPDGADTGDIGSQLQAADYDRTILVYYGKALDGQLDAGWTGKCLPSAPGRITWSFKTVAGVAFDDLTTGEISALVAKNVNYYTRRGGVNIMRDGKVASGEWIDVMRLVDLIHARVQETVYGAQVNNPKIPYTQDGIEAMYGLIDSVLAAELASTENPDGGLSSYTISVPKIEAVADADKINRILRNVSFDAFLSGAIHKTLIRGRVAV